MKKLRLTALALSALVALSVLAACGDGGQKETVTAFELPHYAGDYRNELDDKDKPQYNKELWRRSDRNLGSADPLILDDREHSGYFWEYQTQFVCHYSTDLETWKNGGTFIQLPAGLQASIDKWAPEVIRDEDDGKYYAFFSLRPPADSNAGESLPSAGNIAMVAVSDNAGGPFVPIDFSSAASAGANMRIIDTKNYPQFYAKYALLDNNKFQEAFEKTGIPTNGRNGIFRVYGGTIDNGWVNAIDFHPYVDPDTKDKYLLWSQGGAIAGVKMKNWLTPDWDTYAVLTSCNYYTVEDYVKAQRGEAVDTVPYEVMGVYCNEGPFLYKHKGKYYLTLSISGYTESSYGVMQAVSDSPLGPFRKLTDKENGFILNNDLGYNRGVAGPGHHSFVTVNVGGENKLIMSYHAHTSTSGFTGERCLNFDEVKWVEVEDINGNKLDVMHVNGPTTTVMPSFGIDKEYGDVSGKITEAKLVRGTLEKGCEADSLADGLLPFYTHANGEFLEKYVKECAVKMTSTFELTLDKARTLRGISFYNSLSYDTAFESIKDIVFIGEGKNYIIKELKIDPDVGYFYDSQRDQYGMRFGANCYADFDPVTVKKIRFTVEVPKGKKAAALSEVMLVGKIGE